LRKEFAKSGLQVIVKLASVELKPERPEYSGGTWHVEGQLVRVSVSVIFHGVQHFQNEHICATALHYYSSANISSSSLAFRQHTGGFTHGRIVSRHDQHDWLSEVFGCKLGGSMFQNVRGVDTLDGLLTFPNILERQVRPFELVDRTKPGHRKILVPFLRDPNIKIISSANVPCQRKDWWREDIGPRFGVILPREGRDLVFEGVNEFLIGLEEAKEIRLQVMEERKAFVLDLVAGLEEEGFSFCELFVSIDFWSTAFVIGNIPLAHTTCHFQPCHMRVPFYTTTKTSGTI
jgi:hypothetical protein